MVNIFSTIPLEIKEKIIVKGDFPYTRKLFWDIPLENIDSQKHKDFIVERVIGRGGLYDFYYLLKLYTKEEIIGALKKSRSFDRKIVNFCSLYFHIPKAEMHASPYYD